MSFDDVLRASLSRSLQQSKLPSSAGAPAEIYELERHRDHCRHVKDYRTAQQLEDRLNALKDGYEKNELKELEAQQADELASSDASFQQALQQLLQVWDGRINELQALLQEAEQQMVARQAQEATALLAAQAAVQPRPKFSPALLNMRHIERTLAFQKEFSKADKVKQQADQLELLELSQMGADMAGKQDAERAHLAARHCRERDSASKKAASAVLAAQQRQGYKVEQLTRRYQAVKLSLSRGHAVQRLSLQQGLRGSLGLSRPTKLLGLPSFNSSLTETRGLVPGPVPASGFEAQLPPPSRSAERCRSPLGAAWLYGACAGASPPGSPPAGVRSSIERLAAAAKGCTCAGAGRLCSPPGHQGHAAACRCGAMTDAAAAAAGYGLAMPPLTAGLRSGTAVGRKGSSSSPSGSKGTRPCTRAGSRVTQSGGFGCAGSRTLLRRSSSGGGRLPVAAGAAPAAAGAAATGGSVAAGKKAGSWRGTWGAASSVNPSGISSGKSGTAGSSSSGRGGAGAPLRASTSNNSSRSPKLQDDSSGVSSSSGYSPWQPTEATPRSRLQSLQWAAAVQVSADYSLAQHVVLAPAAVSKPGHLPAAVEQQLMQSVDQHLVASMDGGQLQQVDAHTAGESASPEQAVDGISNTGSSSQVMRAAATAVEGVAPDQAEMAEASALAEAEAAAADDGSVGQQETEHAVVAEHSNVSYCSDFEEEAATHQAAGADAGIQHILAATEAEPAAAAASTEAQVEQAAALEGLEHADLQTEAGVQQLSNDSHVQAACVELTAEAGVSSGMLTSADEGDSPARSREGDATSEEQPAAVVHAAAPADAAQLCSTSDDGGPARADAAAA